MENKKIPFEDFAHQVEQAFRKPLTVPARQVAEDFWNNWQSITELITKGQLAAHVDAFMLVRNFPQYGRYHRWKGGAILSIIAGLAIVWFVPPLGMILIIGGFGLRSYGNHLRFKDAKAFADEVMTGATNNPWWCNFLSVNSI
jgi:hypothetical protein